MSTIRAFYAVPPTDAWRKRKAIYDAWMAADLDEDPPEWLEEYASDEMVLNLGAIARPVSGDGFQGVEIQLADLPPDATKVRVVWEW